MSKKFISLCVVCTLFSAMTLSAVAATEAATKGHYGAPITLNKKVAAHTNLARRNDNFDIVNHDPYNAYHVSIPGWSGILDTNPNPFEPDPPSCLYCQHSSHLYNWPAVIYVNGYAYAVPQHGSVTFFDIYPPSKNLTTKNGKANKAKPRIVIHS